MLPVMRGEVPLMVHARDLRQIKSAVNWAQTNDFKIILVGGRDAWLAADLLAARAKFRWFTNSPSTNPTASLIRMR